ncbi:hypothetical protein PVAND_010913 [Polypedilum vanderplanki]|uniref:Uncharacterized protein n=1 Tax=Polypedilum vanderplanki TaxID=319348 RepID=A0A9J6CH10_POLVA|nr:hypothetical protein PVAND_010913 [Polypedilum vanderplanki]
MDSEGAKVEKVAKEIASAVKEEKITKKRSSFARFFRFKGPKMDEVAAQLDLVKEKEVLKEPEIEVVIKEENLCNEKEEVPKVEKTSTLKRFLKKEKVDSEGTNVRRSFFTRSFVVPWISRKSGTNLGNTSTSLVDVTKQEGCKLETIDLNEDTIITPESNLSTHSEIHEIAPAITIEHF